ncbi:MAG TPA: sugar ABC transporter substrate-binding protein [Casimicrobiaceae bacterium]|nr:sugar ABC transporter substrate-binding protein [Casimicrobiaceae bacterium]
MHSKPWLASLLGAFMLGIAGSVLAATPLKFWTFLTVDSPDPRSAALKSVIEGFNKSQTEYEVQIQSINYGRIDNQVIQATAAGEGPDIINVYSDLLPMHIAAKTIVPVDAYASRMSAAEQSDFVMPLKLFQEGGKQMAVPWETRVWLLWYRKDLLAAAKLQPPKTLEELGEVAGKLTTPQVMGFAMGASTGNLGAGAYETFIPLLWAAGGDLTDAQGKATFNSEAGVKVLSYLHDLETKYQGMRSTVVSMTADDMVSSFKAGTAAMVIGGSYRVAAARVGLPADALVTASIPGWTAAKPSPARVAGQTLAIGASSKHPEGAWKFIQYYLSAPSQIAFAKAGVMPVRLSVYKDPFFQTPQGEETQRWAAYARESGRLTRTPTDFAKLSEGLARAIQEVLLKNADPKKALDAAAAEYNAQHKE